MHAFQSSWNWNDLGRLFQRACIIVACLVGERRPSFNPKACYKESLHSTWVHVQVNRWRRRTKRLQSSTRQRTHKTGSQFHQKQAGEWREDSWKLSQKKNIPSDKLRASQQRPFLEKSTSGRPFSLRLKKPQRTQPEALHTCHPAADTSVPLLENLNLPYLGASLVRNNLRPSFGFKK